jgi:hypothetical protein
MSRKTVIDRLREIERAEEKKSSASVAGTFQVLHHPNNVKYNTWFYGHPVEGENFAWCVVFQQWCFWKAEIPRSVFPWFDPPNVFKVRKWFQDQHRYFDTPMVGDLVIFSKSHIGFVEALLTQGRIQTIEGNSSDRVRRHTYQIGASGIDGYCRPMYHNVEEDDFMALFDNVNEFKDAVRAVVRDEVGTAVQDELKGFYALLARGGDPVPGPTDQHFKDSHRGLDTRLTDIYKLLARGEIDGEINPTGTQFRDSNRHLAKLLEDIAARLPESTPRP